MKHLKMLAITIPVAMALAVLLGAGTASATVLCKENKRPCPKSQDWEFGQTFEAGIIAETTTTLKTTSGTLLNTCTSGIMEGITENTGGSGIPVKIENTKLTFNNCTRTTHVHNPGRLTIEYINEPSNDTFGYLIAKEMEFTVTLPLIGNCTVSTGPELIMGLVTGRKGETAAMIHITTQLEGCLASMPFLAEYHISLPAPLYVKENTA
ncbi:MAG TPA: hypothetical protein VFM51_06780 [Solirubrobacterales bacterium]|nr:hypothetical protein [Solirubrobacterales bacterium]